MAAHVVSDASVSKIRAQIDAATADPTSQIPGFVACVVNKDGKSIFSHASGTRGLGTNEPMTLDNVFWIASCTKMIGGIACMQLVEQCKLSLDDANLVDNVCPELKNVKILKGYGNDGKPILVEKKNRITLRMLLSHTSGFGYSFFSADLRRYGLPTGYDELGADFRDINMPLLFEPGTSWQYGVGIDWAGLMVERVSGMPLNDYFQEYIFKPLGIKNVSMFPTEDMISRLAYMHSRDPTTSKLIAHEHIYRRPLVISPGSAEAEGTFNSAGAGCFAQPSEYTKIISTLLNNGTSPHTGTQILKPATVDEMFKTQIPEQPDFGRVPIPAANPFYTNAIPELYPQPKEHPQGWGLTFMITIEPGATGRGRNTGWWAGLPNLFWWADRERGVGGIVASQILPFADPHVLGLWASIEQAIYQG